VRNSLANRLSCNDDAPGSITSQSAIVVDVGFTDASAQIASRYVCSVGIVSGSPRLATWPSNRRHFPVELHAQFRVPTWQQVAILSLGLPRDDVGQERSWLVGLLLDTEVGTREVQMQTGGRRDRPERVADGEPYVVFAAA
jgi:hypothetical protein